MNCKADVLVAEIGSTTTLVSAFDRLGKEPRFLGQGQAATTVPDGDVTRGLAAAVEDLKRVLHADTLTYGRMLASSSAAGGLKMCVHGLIMDMTVRAAEAAALGAGAVVRLTTAGKLTGADIESARKIGPNLILLAGGTDGGERETAEHNARRIAEANLGAPVIYAGNAQCVPEVERVFANANAPLYVTENVYPRLDELNIEPARKIIHRVFTEHITKAPGMERIRELVSGAILPTPGAVMEAARLLYGALGDLVVLDIGGATTDVHSVSGGSEEIAALLTSPEPFAKRTVEGDLGLYINAAHLVDRAGAETLSRELGIDVPAVMARYRPIPDTPEQFRLTERLCREAGETALVRHAGRLRYLYTPSGRRTVAEGKDLTLVRTVIGTGGALTRLPHRELLLRRIADCNRHGLMLFPKPGQARLLFDEHYILSSAGVLAAEVPEAALALMLESLGVSREREQI